VVVGVALVAATGEAIDAFFVDEPVGALVFAALFVGAALWAWRRPIGGVVAVGVLCLLELAGLPFYARDTAADWIVQVLATALAAIGVVAAFLELRRWRTARSSSPRP